MKDYFEILDIPVTATREEIKAQYKQLVRVYHPDRFRDAADKAYAEEKLKQINIAFQVLCGTPMPHNPPETTATPRPIAYPPVLDFGLVRAGAKRMLPLQIGNLGGPVTTIQLRRKIDAGLFRISKGKRVYADRPFPINYEVAIDTQGIRPGSLYQEWIEIDLDGIIMHVELRIQTNPAQQGRLDTKRYFPLPKWWVSAILAVVLLCLLVVALPALPQLSHYDGFPLAAYFAPPFYRLEAAHLLFSVQENDFSALYAGSAGGDPTALEVNGRGAVGNVAGQQVAYLDNKGEVTLLSLASGVRTVVTADGEPKTALRWSPAGTHLAYLAGSEEQRRLVVYTLATGLRRELPGQATTGVSHYAWSPDGSALAFDLRQGTARRVYRMAVDGSGLQPLTRFDSWGAAWSADGRSLVVSAADGLYRLDSGGRMATQVSAVQGEAPSWSADGQWLAYLTDTADGQTLWVMALASGETTAVSTESVSYAWSPVGAVLGYVTGRMTAATPLLYLWTVTPGQAPTLVAEINDPLFQWTQ